MLIAYMLYLGIMCVILLLGVLLHNVVARCCRQQVLLTTRSDLNDGSIKLTMGASPLLVLATMKWELQQSFYIYTMRLNVVLQLHYSIGKNMHLLLMASS
jgi:hypothetical protein